MRSLLIMLAVLVMISTDLKTFAGTHTSKELPLHRIAAILQTEGIEIDGWEMVAKETFLRENLETVKAALEQQLPDAGWEHASDRNSEKSSLIYRHKETGITEKFIVVVPKEKRHPIEIIYKVNGSHWGADSDRFLASEFFVKKDRIFSDNVAIFTCAKTVISGIIDDVLVYQILEQALDIKTIEMIDETDFTSISGYTPEWEQTIPLQTSPMNVQFAARKGLGAGTNITIGTPIITSEY